MKKMAAGISVVIILTLSLFLIACSPDVLYVCPDGSKVEDAALCNPQQREENTIVPVEDEKPAENLTDGNLSENYVNPTSVPKDVAKILEKRNNLVSASYVFRLNDQGSDVYLKGSTMKIYVPVPKVVLKDLQYDAIIVDLTAHAGQGYCERERYCDPVGYRADVEEKFFHYYSPFDWLEEIETAEKIGEGQIKSRKVWVVRVNGDRLYHIDYYFGIPIKVEVGKDIYLYDDIVYNKVTDYQVQFEVREDR